MVRDRCSTTEVRLEAHKIRCWSAVWRVMTDDGVYYAKQNCPGQAFEAALMPVLAGLSDRVVPVTAVDPDRGFLLTPDQGPVMGEAVGDSVETWVAVAREAALLQRELVGHVDELERRRLHAARRGRGGDVRRDPARAVRRAARRATSAASTTSGAARLRSVLPELERWADQVLALGLPVTPQPQRPARQQRLRASMPACASSTSATPC